MKSFDVEKYLHLTEAFELSINERRELVTSIGAVVSAFCDDAFGLDPTAISLRAAAKKAFDTTAEYDSFSLTRRDTRDDPDAGDATNSKLMKEVSGDDSRRPSQGDHLLPGL